MIDQSIKKLVTYALEKKLIKEDDKIYCTNSLLAILGLDEYNEPEEEYKNVNLESTLKEILDFAFEKNLFPENSTVYRDLFDTKVMSVFVDRPSNVNIELLQRKLPIGSTSSLKTLTISVPIESRRT